MNACINHLRQIDAAANEFALERNLKAGDKINFPDDLTPFIKLNSQGKIPSCPSGGIYTLKKSSRSSNLLNPGAEIAAELIPKRIHLRRQVNSLELVAGLLSA
jgi:hypothetical protein